jgi:hypothetical protein
VASNAATIFDKQNIMTRGPSNILGEGLKSWSDLRGCKLVCNLEKVLCIFRHQGFVMMAKKGQNQPDEDLPPD